MPNSKTTAVVILNWNGLTLLQQFLPKVVQHTPEKKAEIWIADNGSTDDSVVWTTTNFPQVKVLKLNQNFGFAQGYNSALAQIPATYYVLLNSDIEVTPGWLDPCIKMLNEMPEIAALQPKVLSLRDKKRFEYAGAAGGYIDRYGYPFCRGRVLSVTEEDYGQYNQSVSLFWATGACMFIRSEVFHSSGGFDGDFFAHMEEIDLCWRLKNRGWRIGIAPESVVYHLGGATLSYQSRQKIFLNFRNNLLMLVKNLPEYQFKRRILARMILDGVAALRFLIMGEWTAFTAVLKSHGAFYSMLPQTLSKRKLLQKQISPTEHPEIFPKSMVFGFYFKKIQRFSEFPFHAPPL